MNYGLPTTRGLPECSALGCGLDFGTIFMFHSHDIWCLYVCFIVLCFPSALSITNLLGLCISIMMCQLNWVTHSFCSFYVSLSQSSDGLIFILKHSLLPNCSHHWSFSHSLVSIIVYICCCLFVFTCLGYYPIWVASFHAATITCTWYKLAACQ